MSIITKLRDEGKLSSAEQQIAKFILENPQQIIRMSIREIAKLTYTSPTTVMRLCRKISDGGFAEFRIDLASEVESFSKKVLTQEDEKLSQHFKETAEIIGQIEQSISESLRLTRQLLNEQVLLDVVNVILNSKTIDIYGRGASNSVGEDFHYKMYRLGFNTHIYKGVDLQYIQAQNSDSTHCGLVISSTGETPEILKIANTLNSKGTPVITLTGSQDSSLLKNSDYALYFKSFESNLRVGAITSRSAMQYALDVLYFLIYNSDYEKNFRTVLNTYVPENLISKE